MTEKSSHGQGQPIEQALRHIDYLNLMIVSAAAAPDRLPYCKANPDIDLCIFQQQMGSIVCLLQTHLNDLYAALHETDETGGRFADFRPLIANTVTRIKSGANTQETLHRHIRNVFAFETNVSSDCMDSCGTYTRYYQGNYVLAIGWVLMMVASVEQGLKLHEILGDAQNTEVCHRMCFAAVMNTLQTWRRDLSIILAGSTSVM